MTTGLSDGVSTIPSGIPTSKIAMSFVLHANPSHHDQAPSQRRRTPQVVMKYVWNNLLFGTTSLPHSVGSAAFTALTNPTTESLVRYSTSETRSDLDNLSGV